eukprot:173557_1
MASSLYAFENSTTYDVIFSLFFIVLTTLIALSIFTVYRSRYIQEAEKKPNYINLVRYIVVWCLLLEFLTFLGYYIGYVPLFAIVWNLWVPSWTAGYLLLSINVAIFESNELTMKQINIDQQRHGIKWLLLWGGCSLSEWIASLCGWVFGAYRAQAVGYMLWKLIAFIILVLLMKMLLNGKRRIEALIDDASDPLLKKTERLIVIELILAIFLFISVIYETYVIISVFEGSVISSIYVTQATLIKMVVYFPLWTLINTVLLVYGWIPRGAMHPMMPTLDIDGDKSVHTSTINIV